MARKVGYLRFNEERKCWILSGEGVARLSEVPTESASKVEVANALRRFRHYLEDANPGIEFIPTGPDEFRLIYPNEDQSW